MNRRYRKTVIAGNWKMNKTPKEARALVDTLRPLISKAKWCTTVLCVPFVDLSAALKATRATKIAIGAQNMHYENSGPYTGEVSGPMLVEMGVKYVIVGHSERRQYFAETDEIVNKKGSSSIRMRPSSHCMRWRNIAGERAGCYRRAGHKAGQNCFAGRAA
jgi:triosephosphate isomerase